MSRGEAEVCAQCRSFAMKEYPELARSGKGRCTGYDDAIVPLRDSVVPWDQRTCVLYTRASNQAERVKWFEAQEAKRQKTEVQPEMKG